MAKDPASSGHRLGQLIGDWWEEYVVLPMLKSVAADLHLFVDSRHAKRSCRGKKVDWADAGGNSVDYDFVLEIGGSLAAKGIPVAFMESFWRRGARHSKDKARDDTNKLLPMRDTYPSARFLAIAACGEFTEPARDYVKSRDVALFFVPKTKIVEAFAASGFSIDYDDQSPEADKARIARIFQDKLDTAQRQQVAANLRRIVGQAAFDGFVHTVVSALCAVPVDIEISEATLSEPMRFQSIAAAAAFLQAPRFAASVRDSHYRYRVTYSDGSEFARDLDGLSKVQQSNSQLQALLTHMATVTSRHPAAPPAPASPPQSPSS